MMDLKVVLLLLAILFCGCKSSAAKDEDFMDKLKINQFKENGYSFDSFTTSKGRQVNIVFIKHGSIVLDIDGFVVYIDPVTMFGNDLTVLPKADMIIVTHEHHDHFDPKAIEELSSDSTLLYMSERVSELYGRGTGLVPGETVEIEPANFSFTTVPAYNISPDHLQFHPKERKDIGVVFDIDGFRVYVAGDTEDIPEMADLTDIDVAFIPVNQPYTMTPEQAIHAAEMIHPKILYPYHYGQTDLSPLVERFKGSEIDVRVRQLQ